MEVGDRSPKEKGFIETLKGVQRGSCNILRWGTVLEAVAGAAGTGRAETQSTAHVPDVLLSTSQTPLLSTLIKRALKLMSQHCTLR